MVGWDSNYYGPSTTTNIISTLVSRHAPLFEQAGLLNELASSTTISLPNTPTDPGSINVLRIWLGWIMYCCKKRDICRSIMANGIFPTNYGTATIRSILATMPLPTETTSFITMTMIIPKTSFILWKIRMGKKINGIWTIGQARG